MPIVVFLCLLAIPIGLSMMHGYQSTRLDHAIADKRDETLVRDRLLSSDNEDIKATPDPRRKGVSETTGYTPFAVVRRWLNLPG